MITFKKKNDFWMRMRIQKKNLIGRKYGLLGMGRRKCALNLSHRMKSNKKKMKGKNSFETVNKYHIIIK